MFGLVLSIFINIIIVNPVILNARELALRVIAKDKKVPLADIEVTVTTNNEEQSNETDTIYFTDADGMNINRSPLLVIPLVGS
jgi:hypothetical protein